MPTLPAALQRLYLPHGAAPPAPGDAVASLIDADGLVRALVLELARPADWPLVSSVWRGVQTDLGWPAPAIAVSGIDGYQLWISLQQPVTVAQAQGLLAGLCARYLGEVAPQRLRLLPSAAQPLSLAALPPTEVRSGQWSAFVAPDLAPVFADEPWIDLPPNPEGQAELLSRLKSIEPDAWAQGLAHLQPASVPVPVPVPGSLPTGAQDSALAAEPVHPALATAVQGGEVPLHAPLGQHGDPRQFLLEVMNHPRLPLALRIDAAKALLPWHSAAQQPAVHLPAASNSMVLPDSGT
jgi:hypothetical protein